ncbi:E3 ubiquitin-protein ligase brl2 [Schizosaccharomyces pombe]
MYQNGKPDAPTILGQKRELEDVEIQDDDIQEVSKEDLLKDVRVRSIQFDELESKIEGLQNLAEEKLKVLATLVSWWPEILQQFSVVFQGNELKDFESEGVFSILEKFPELSYFNDAVKNNKTKALSIIQKLLSTVDSSTNSVSRDPFSVLSIDDSSLTEKLNTINLDIDKILDELDTTRSQLHSIIKLPDRSSSFTLQCINESVRPQSTKVKEEATTSSKGKDEEKKVSTVEQRTQLQQLSRLQDQQNGLMESRSQSLKILDSNVNDMDKLIMERENALNNVETTNLEKYSSFLALKEAVSMTSEQLRVLEHLLSECSHEINVLSQQSKNFNGVFESSYQPLINDLEHQISVMQNDEKRINNAKTELSLSLEKKLEAKKQKEKVYKDKLDELANLETMVLEKKKAVATREAANKIRLVDLNDLELQKDLSTYLSKELASTEKAFRLVKQQTVKSSHSHYQELITKFSVEKEKAEQKYFLTMKSTDSLHAEVKLLRQKYQKTNEIITKMLNSQDTAVHRIIEFEDQLARLSSVRNNSIKQSATFQVKKSSQKSTIQNLEEKVSYLQQFMDKNNATLTDLESQCSDLSSSIDILSKQDEEHEKEKRKLKDTGVSTSAEELKTFRAMCKCSVCNFERWKDRIISLCGHGFCYQCIQKRIETRQRRCPICGRGFGASDVIPIHL